MMTRLSTTMATILIRTLIVVAATVIVLPVRAQNPEAEVLAFLQKRDMEIKAAVGEMSADATVDTRDAVAELINARIDFGEMGRRALGPHANDLSEEELERFINTFAAIVRSQALGDLSVYQAEIAYKDISVTGDEASAHTSAVMKDVTLPVKYLLLREDNNWWLYDIVIDGVSTIDGYAVSFRSFIRKRGFDTFMANLDRRLARSQGE